ncbi:MAG: hypothetical protein ACRD96_00255 [Bryobacteraceae bacterium]
MLRTLAATACLAAMPVPAEEPKRIEVERAFTRLYNFDFAGAHAALDRHLAAHPADSLALAARASAYLFAELNRLGILEGDFFANDDRLVEKKKLKPDPELKAKLFESINRSQSLAQKILAGNPDDADALFSMCLTHGIVLDYTAFVEKKHIGSLASMRKATGYAIRLIQVNPFYYDAYASAGMAEYVLGSLPFFLRWFVRVDGVQASKERGVQNIELTAAQGRYLKPFAKILLAVAHLRAKKPRLAHAILSELARDFPENPLFLKELDRLTPKLRN